MSKSKPDLEAILGFRLSPEMLAQIHSIVEQHVNEKLEEVLRKLLEEKLDDAIKKCLEEKEKHVETEVTELKEIPERKATTLIENYVKSHPRCLTSDIIFDLKLDPDLVLEILSKLEKAKKVRGESIESK